MDRRFVATLALRLMGLYILIQALLPLGYVCSEVVQAISRESFELARLSPTISALVVLLGCGLALLRWAPALAARWIGPGEPGAEESGPTPRALEQLGYRLLGAYAVVTNVPSLVSQVGFSFGMANAFGYDFLTRDLVTAILGASIGLWLLLGARGLVGLVDRLRGAGLQESEKAWKAP